MRSMVNNVKYHGLIESVITINDSGIYILWNLPDKPWYFFWKQILDIIFCKCTYTTWNEYLQSLNTSHSSE